MFWGLIMEPNKRYTQVVEKAFHISQAAMDISTGDTDPCQVMVVVEGKNYLVCTLQKNKTIQVPIDLYFRAGDSVSFLTNGKCNVHLTGYLDPELEDDLLDEEEDDDEEATTNTALAKNKRKLETSNDGVANKKAKPDKKKGKAADESDSEDEKDQLHKLLEGGDVDSDENDDSFKMNASAEADDSDEEDSDDDDDDDDEDEDDDDDDEEEEEEENGAKEESSEEAETTLDTSKEESQVDLSKLSKNQRRRLKKKQQQSQQAGQQPQVNGIDKSKKEKPAQQKQEKKKEAKAEEQPAEKKEKKSLSGGVSIEDLKVGTGAPAKAGKIVQVYYEGRLQQNNKMFDNCLKGPGFKFRLGSKEVITGWDVGVAGMKVGGKRKIICPPAMAYGAKGSPPVIPPNSTLVFEVELKNVK